MLDYTYVNLITKLFFHYSTFYASIFLFFSSPLIAQEYKDLESMLMDLKPYVDDIQNGYLKVEYDQERIAKISWLDQDSTEFSRVFHYNGDDLSLITEFREKSILKEFHFNSHSVTGRFIEFLFGKNFFTDDKFITEVRYNHLNFPIFYNIETFKKVYVGHIIVNYNVNGDLLREVWYQDKKKVMEFQ